MIDRRSHPSDVAWARHLAGESGWIAARRMRRHLAGCASCRRLQSEMAEERRAFHADPLRSDELRLLQARAAATREKPRWLLGPAWVIAGGALAAALVAVAVRSPGPRLVEKGPDVFTLHVERPSGPAPLGSRCAPGDRLIGRYRTQRRYLLVLERDGLGAIQAVAPPGGAASMRLSAGEGTTPASWILDAAPGRECFIAFFSDDPIAFAAASRAVAQSVEAPAIPGAVVRVSCCEKEASR